MLAIIWKFNSRIFVNGQLKDHFVFQFTILIVKTFQLIFAIIKKNVIKIIINVQLENNVKIMYKSLIVGMIKLNTVIMIMT